MARRKAEQLWNWSTTSTRLTVFGHPEGHELYSRDTLRLERNFRTHGAIVNFNNALFSSLNTDLGLQAHKEVYSQERVGQKPNKTKIKAKYALTLEADNANDLKDSACEKTVERIEELADRGHSYSTSLSSFEEMQTEKELLIF